MSKTATTGKVQQAAELGKFASAKLRLDAPAADESQSIENQVDPHETEESSEEPYDAEATSRVVLLTCVITLTLIAIGFAMFFAKSIILPILFAFLLNFFFSPLILRMKRFGVPSFAGAFLLLLASLALVVLLTMLAYEPARQWIKDAPRTIGRVEERLRTLQAPIEDLKETSRKLDAIVTGDPGKQQSDGDSSDKTKKGELNSKSNNSWFGSELIFGSDESEANAQHIDQAKKEIRAELESDRPVAVAFQQPSLTGFILNTTGNATVGISLSVVILFFLLAAGDRGLEKMVELMPTWREKRNIVELTRNIQQSISRYMMTTATINAGLGIVIGTGMWMIGLPNPVLWGVMAAFLNFLPFVGAIIGAVIVFLVAAVSFDSMTYSLLAPGIYLGVNLVEANFVTPTLLGRSISLHPVWLMVFFAFIGWMWGVSGAIIAVPILAVIKITCDHVPPLEPVGRFLGR